MSAASSATESPRARLIAALAGSIKQKGYRETTVADIVAAARTSRRTFYQHFEDRSACFLALFEQVTQAKLELIAAAVDPDAGLDEQVERAIDVYIDGISADPELQQSFTRELPGMAEAGSEAVHQVTERYAELLVTLVQQARLRHPERDIRALAPDVAIILVGGLRELLVMAIQQGRDLHDLRHPSIQVVQAVIQTLVSRSPSTDQDPPNPAGERTSSPRPAT